MTFINGIIIFTSHFLRYDLPIEIKIHELIHHFKDISILPMIRNQHIKNSIENNVKFCIGK